MSPKPSKSAFAVAMAAAMYATPHAAISADHVPYPSLAGTIWLSETTHTRTAISISGTLELKEGKNIYVKFLDLNDGVYTIQVHWWNEEKNINAVEYGVLVQEEENVFSYIESDHPEGSGFPGIAGYGTFELIDANTAEFSQLGRLADGSASAFVNRLKRVSEAPEVPIPQTYPPSDQNRAH